MLGILGRKEKRGKASPSHCDEPRFILAPDSLDR